MASRSISATRRPFRAARVAEWAAALILILLSSRAAYAGQVTLGWDPNTEPDLAGYKVYVGESSGAYQPSINVGLNTSYAITNLQNGKVYYFAVTAYDSSGNESGRSVEVSTTIVDTSPPAISAVAVPTRTVSGASITWTTDEASDSQVEYGLTTAYGSATVVDGSLVTSHSVTIGGLAENSLYHFRVRSRDVSGNLAISADFTFTTLEGTPPSISITTPAAGATVSGSVTVGATATDNVGVIGVQFKVDGTPFGAEDTVAPYAVGWDTMTVSDGAHTLTAAARDAAGNVGGSAAVSVTVMNGIVRLSPQDTSLNINATNYSSDARLTTYTWPDNRVANAILLKFDLTALPPGALVQDATLHLALVASDGAADATYTVTAHKVVGKTPVLAAATGYTADGVTGWTANTCCYNNVPLAQADISPAYATQAINKTPGDKTWTITTMVQEWVAAPTTNFGLLLNSDATKLADRYRYFASMEHADPSLRPFLRITYSTSPPPDTTPPTISGVTVSGITSSGATIGWTTNEVSDSQVEHGMTTAYGSTTAVNATLVTAHSVTLSGLPDATLHHFRVRSRDAAGNLATSPDFTFTTLDGTAPGVSITAPAAGTTVSGTTTVTATATDNVGVASVQFRLGSVNLGAADTTAPYSVAWDTRTVGNGLHTLTAVARDAAGNTKTAVGVDVTVANDTTAPVLSGIGASGITTSAATITWTTDESSDSQVDYGTTKAYASTSVLSTTLVTSHTVTLGGLAENTLYHFRVRSRDAAGNLTISGDFTFTTIEGTLPSVSITAPAAGVTVSGTITVGASASDNVGVVGVQFELDGAPLGAEDTVAPYSVGWDTITGSDGPHSLTAVARDAAGNVGVSAVTSVTVANGILRLSPQDTSLNVNATNYSSDATLTTYTWPDNRVANAILLKFDLSALPAGAVVQDATLHLALVQSDGAAEATYTVTAHKVVGKNPVIATATGYTTDGVTDWTPNTCCANNVPLAQADISPAYATQAVDKTLGDKTWTITTMVQEWVANPTTNVGLLLNSDATKLADRFRYFASMEHADPSLRPFLRITYSTSPPPDTTFPTVSISSPAAGASLSGTVAVAASATDNVGVGGVQFRLDGAPLGAEDTAAPYTVDWNTTTASSGTHALTAVARDAAGNATTSAGVTVTVANPVPDTTPPVISGVAASGITSSGATIGWTTDEASDSQVEYGTTTAYGSATPASASLVTSHSVTLSGLLDATTCHFRVHSRDAAGNPATSPDYTFTTPDGSPPTVSISSPAAGASVSGTITVAASATDNVGVASVQFNLDGANLGAKDTTAPYSVSWDTTNAVAGAHTLTAVALDAAGNSKTSAGISVTVLDITAPVISGVTVSGITSSGATIGWTTNEVSDSQVEHGTTAVNASLVTTHSAALSGLADATLCHFRVRSRDAAGNLATSPDFTFTTLDGTPPAVSVTAPAAGTTVSGTTTVTATATDNVGVASVQLQLDGANLGAADTTAPYSVAWDTRTVGNGLHMLTAVARDAAGNTTTAAGVAVTVANDTTAPVLSSIGASGITTSAATITWTTDEASDSQVDYGTTTAYGSTTAVNATLVTSHAVALSGLVANTLYHFGVRSRDTAGNLATSADFTFTTLASDATAPTVAITAPAPGVSVSGTVTVAAVASDDVAVVGVQFRLDGGNLGAEVTAAPYTLVWATTAVTDGVHTLTAVARDAAGNVGVSVAVSVTVANGILRLSPQDTSLNVNATNYSSNATLTTYTWPDNRVANAILLKFDLSALPAGAVVQDATLHLALVQSDGAAEGTYTVTAHKVVGKNPVLATATGYTADGVTGWTANACCYNNVPLAQADISPAYATQAVDKTFGDKTWTITGMVQEWLADPASNFGLLLNSDASKLRDRYRYFASMEHPNASLRPFLRIAYSPPPDGTLPTVSITTPAAGASVSGTVIVEAGASDNVGVVGVQFRLDGAPLGTEVTIAPYTVAWDTTTTVSDGSHTLTAVARDAAGNASQSAAVTVRVANGILRLSPQDTSLNINATNYSSDSTLTTYTWPDNRVANAILLKFDLAALPAGAVVQDATLHLALVQSDGAAEATYTVTAHKVVGRNPVLAAATGYTADGVTGWTPNACCYNSVPLAQADISPAYATQAVDKTFGDKAWTITGMVQEWVADPTTNFGLLLNSDATKLADRYRSFASREHPDASLRPFLRIAYSIPPPPDTTPPSVTVTAPAAGASLSGTVAVAASATDNVGVAGVQFRLDGAPLGAEVTAAPYTVDWNTTTASPGTHTLTAIARDAAGNATSSAGISMTVLDITPPVISAVTASAPSSSGATISWTTNEVGDSQVEYGTTTAYGSLSPLDGVPATSHAQTLGGLAAGTLYHFRVRSRDGVSIWRRRRSRRRAPTRSSSTQASRTPAL